MFINRKRNMLNWKCVYFIETVILLNHKKAMNIPNRLIILYYISFICT